MRAALHPAGILIGHTLPVLVLAALYADALSVIHPLLSAESLGAWRLLGIALGGIVTASTAYTALLWLRKGRVHALYGALVFLAYVPMLWAIAAHIDVLFPWDVPRWMMPQDAELYAFRLLSLPLAHALFVLVARSLPEGERGRPVRDILFAAAIPLAVFLFVQVVEPFRLGLDFERHLWVVVTVCLTIAFLFLLLRGVTALVLRLKGGSALALAARIVVGLVLPLLGLALNNGLLAQAPGAPRDAVGLFGNLAHPAFYLIALLNGAAVAWPSSRHPTVRLIQFALRAAGLPYVLYFFVLFVPLLPLSIVAIVAVGLGFLLLAPVMLFALQATLLWQDARFLLAHRPWPSLAGVFAAAMAVLPATIVLKYLSHRSTLHGALRHVYESDMQDPIHPLDAEALAQVLEQVEANRARNRWRGNGTVGGNTPFLTPLYNRLVLDHLTLSEEKAAALAQVVLDAEPSAPERARALPNSVHTALDSAWAESRYDEEQQAWRSWVHLAVSNAGEWQEEFATEIALPDGAWVSDHYLVIGGDTAKGVLAEKKAALWVYNRIVSYRRDPSIVRYTGHNRLQLRVFPVEAGQQRRTGFELLHREALPLRFGGRQLLLGDPARDPAPAPVESGEPGVVFMPAALKAALPRIRRGTLVHLVVDATELQRVRRGDVIGRVRRFAEAHGLNERNTTLHLTDGYGVSLPYGEDALAAFAQHAGHGGFFTDRPIRSAIAEALLRPGASAPLIVVVPSRGQDDQRALGLWLDDLPDLAALLPEGDRFLVLGEDGALTAHRFRDPGQRLEGAAATLAHPEVLAWPAVDAPLAYLPDTPQGSVAVDYTHLGAHSTPRPRWWKHALALEGRQRALALRSRETGVGWAALVRGSFAAQVLMPQTAWLCLEDEAQRNALMKKQEEVLHGHQSLDTMDEEVTNMPEPAIWWLLPVLLLPLLRRRRAA